MKNLSGRLNSHEPIASFDPDWIAYVKAIQNLSRVQGIPIKAGRIAIEAVIVPIAAILPSLPPWHYPLRDIASGILTVQGTERKRCSNIALGTPSRLFTIYPILFALFFWQGMACADNFKIELKLGAHAIQAEIPATPEAHMRGLMYRTNLPEDQGMLFAFRFLSRQCLWMRNTLIPLSVAFLDDAGTILNVEEMQPRTLQTHCSNGTARYALEMNSGWFVRHGVNRGTVVSGPLKTAKPM